jgi:hypothetical protein
LEPAPDPGLALLPDPDLEFARFHTDRFNGNRLREKARHDQKEKRGRTCPRAKPAS